MTIDILVWKTIGSLALKVVTRASSKELSTAAMEDCGPSAGPASLEAPSAGAVRRGDGA